MTNSSKPSRVTSKIRHNYFSNYAAAPSQFITESVNNKYSYTPLSQRPPVSI